MYRVVVKKVNSDVGLSFLKTYITDFTEIVYISEEFIFDEFSTTNICYRVKNKIIGKGSPQELTELLKVKERLV